MRLTLGLAALLALSACTTAPDPVSMNQTTASLGEYSAAPAFNFAPVHANVTRKGNTELAENFVDLEFRMESGRPLPVFTRFEGPITIGVAGDIPPSALADLDRLIGRFRTEAGLSVSRTSGPASITVNFVTRSTIREAFSNVACFVAPNVSSWDEYKAARGTGQLDWTRVTERRRLSVFAPADASPQEVRDCLHEELAQAMGPLNDLYQLDDSVFNDDNIHSVLTGFDMMMLRVHYAPELHSGMTQGEVTARLPGILSRLNPGGTQGGHAVRSATPRQWISAIEGALGARGSNTARMAGADQALATARAQGWKDSRLAFSYFAIGRTNIASRPDQALAAFSAAANIYRSLPGGELHAAHVDMQMAAYALSQGRADQTVQLVDRALPVVKSGENAAMTAMLLMMKSEAMRVAGQADAAAALRLDSTPWARYGFGADSEVRSRERGIRALVPAAFR